MRSILLAVDHFIVFLLLFVSSWVALSIAAGYTIGITWVVPAVSLLIAWFLFHRLNRVSKEESNDARARVVAIALGSFLLFAGWAFYVLFAAQHGFDLSADATPSIVTKLIGEKIPTHFSGYYPDLPFLYQLGMPVIASQLSFSGAPTHLVVWFLALLGMLFTLYFISRLAYQWMGSHAAVLFACALFLSTRFPFLNVLVGEYPWMLALGMVMGGIWIWSRDPLLGGIIFGAAWIVHPYLALGGLVFLFLVERLPLRAWVTGIVLMLVLAIPSVITQLLPFFSSGSTALREILWPGLPSIMGGIALVGVIPFLVGVATIIIQRDAILRESNGRKFLFAFVFIFIVYFVTQLIPSASFAAKILQWSSIGLVFFGAWMLSQLFRERKMVFVAACLILVLSAGIIFTSNDINRLVSGSKSTLRDAEFAMAFREFDPTPQRTLFVSSAGGKIAQYADKIPLHTMNANFILAVFVLRTPAVVAYRDTAAKIDDAIRTRCVECLNSFPATYWVIDTQQFPALPDRAPLFMYGDFIVYSGMVPSI